MENISLAPFSNDPLPPSAEMLSFAVQQLTECELSTSEIQAAQLRILGAKKK